MVYLTPTARPTVLDDLGVPVETDTPEPTPEAYALSEIVKALGDMYALLDKVVGALRAQNAAIKHIDSHVNYRRETDARKVADTVGTVDV